MDNSKNNRTNIGKKWEDEEEIQLLDELHKNIIISEIAKIHNRTQGGITSRIRFIAKKMHIQNIHIEEIIEKTKLNINEINDIIEKQESHPMKKESSIIETDKNKIIEIKESNYEELKTDIREMKAEISNLKSTIQELVEMMKAIYEFEEE